MARLFLFLAFLCGAAAPLYAQAPPPAPAPADPVEGLVRRVERILNAGDRTALPPLFAPTISDLRIQQHVNDLFTRGAIRTVVFERARA